MKVKTTNTQSYLGCAAIALATALCSAQSPQLGGPMEHIGIQLIGTEIHLSVFNPGPMELYNYNETYSGGASVLNGRWYNAQFGWLAEGFWQPPAGSQVWIEQIATEPDLWSHMGGTFAPIFGTDSSSMRIHWVGTMLHNWYSATEPGEFELEYMVYLGDSAGAPTAGYTPGFVTLSWIMDGGCYADCDSSGALNILDYICFGDDFANGGSYADCDSSGSLNILDYICFGDAFAAGCP